jgi:hypothetical protein
MRYMRCRCGKLKSWTSMGSPPCRACDECGVTRAESPAGHREPAPHNWEQEWKIDPKTGERWREWVCTACLTRESPRQPGPPARETDRVA